MKQSLKALGKWMGLSILGTHLLTQGAYSLNQLKNTYYPSEQRATFEHAYGIKLSGWSEDIEGYPEGLASLADGVWLEMQEKPFSLQTIQLESENYLKKTFVQQLKYLITGPYQGFYNPLTDNIALISGDYLGALHHEIKHAKTKKAPKELVERWKMLANDEHGNSLYRNPFLSQIRGVDAFIEDEEVGMNNEHLGFVSDYARTNVLEDIAELGKYAEMACYEFIYYLGYGGQARNERIAAKVSLAQEYDIIPREFSEYVFLLALEQITIDDTYVREEPVKLFMEATDAFLAAHPTSIYDGRIRLVRASIYENSTNRESLEQAIKEYEQILENPRGVGHTCALSALLQLKKVHKILGNEEEEKKYGAAYIEYWKRIRKGDVLLPQRGINDFLEANWEQL